MILIQSFCNHRSLLCSTKLITTCDLELLFLAVIVKSCKVQVTPSSDVLEIQGLDLKTVLALLLCASVLPKGQVLCVMEKKYPMVIFY